MTEAISRRRFLTLAGAGATGVSELTDAAPGERGSDPTGRDGSELVARLPIDSHVREGEPITLWYEPRRLQVFDPASGRRVSEDSAVVA